MMSVAIRVLAVVVSFSAAASGADGNWPSFRGPNGSGIGSGSPPIRWDVKTGENIRWKTPIPGLAHSSPIVWGDRVFLTTAVSSKTAAPELKTGWLKGSGDSPVESEPWTWKVLCLDRASGRVVWSQDASTGVPKMKRHQKATHANCTPATDGIRVVAFFGSEGIYSYDLGGKLLWKKDLGVLESGPYNARELQWGFASSPIIAGGKGGGGKVILQCDALNGAFWASFDAETGRELRRVERKESATWATPAVIETGGRVQLILNGWKHMGGYDLETGEELWKLAGGGDLPVPAPQTAGGIIYLTNGHGKSPIYAIRADARGDLTPREGAEKHPDGLLWWKPRHGSYMPTPLVLGDNLYVASDNGVVAAFDAKSGEERFRTRIEGGGTFSASVVAADGRLYFANEDGDVFVLKAGNSYELLARNSMGEVCMATPAISDGLLLVRTRGHLYCIATGQGLLKKSRVHSAPELGGITDVVFHPGRAGGRPELVVAFTAGAVFLDAATYEARRTVKLNDGNPPFTPYHIVDADGDGDVEFFREPHAASPASLQDDQGRVLWKLSPPGGGFPDATYGDLDGDGKEEFLLFSSSDKVSMVDHGGRIQWTQSWEKTPKELTVLDTDGDGRREIVYIDGHALCIRDRGGALLVRDVIKGAHYVNALEEIRFPREGKEGPALIVGFNVQPFFGPIEQSYRIYEPDGRRVIKDLKLSELPPRLARHPVKLGPDGSTHFALIQEIKHQGAALAGFSATRLGFYVYDAKDTLVFEEVITSSEGERAKGDGALAVVPDPAGGQERILVGYGPDLYEYKHSAR